MDRWAGKIAVVTGAGSGIGEAIATELIRHRVNVIAVDIAYEKLKSVAENWERLPNRGEYYLKKCDISKEKDVDDVFTFVESLGGVNIMVNNAGIVDMTRLLDTNWGAVERLVNIIMIGTTMFTIRAARSMEKHKTDAHIINVNSVVGLILPTSSSVNDDTKSYNVYPACKHATVVVTETMRRELAKIGSKIRVTSICPSMVQTNITAHDPEVREYLKKMPGLEPLDIASSVIYALSLRSEVELSEILIRHTGTIE